MTAQGKRTVDSFHKELGQRRTAWTVQELLLGNGEPSHQGLWMQIQIELRKRRSGLFVHSLSIDEPKRVCRLAPKKNVLGNGQIGNERELLEDRGYTKAGPCSGPYSGEIPLKPSSTQRRK